MPDTTSAPIPTTEEQVNKHYIIGDNLRHKAFYEDAVDEYQRALCEQEPDLGANSTVVAKTHYGLGLSYRFVKEYKQAIHHLKTAVEIFEAAVDPNNKKDELEQDVKNCKINLARTYHSHGVDLQRGGEYDRSILEHRKAVAIREHTLGRSHLETARSYYVMGCALSDRGNFDEALGELRRALRTRLLVFGKDHMDVREVVENIGTVLYARGGMEADAITEYKMIILRSLEYENEGDDLCRKQEYENGMICYRKGLSLEEQCLGDLHPTTCDLYLRMAVSCCGLWRTLLGDTRMIYGLVCLDIPSFSQFWYAPPPPSMHFLGRNESNRGLASQSCRVQVSHYHLRTHGGQVPCEDGQHLQQTRWSSHGERRV